VINSPAHPTSAPSPPTGLMAQRLHDELVADLMASIGEGLACSPDPPDIDLDSIRRAVSSLAWHGLATSDTDLLWCVRRACDACGFDSGGSLTIRRWGQVLQAQAVHAGSVCRRLQAEDRPDLSSALALLHTVAASLIERSPHRQQFMDAIDQAGRAAGESDG